jgi:hypothetical protein
MTGHSAYLSATSGTPSTVRLEAVPVVLPRERSVIWTSRKGRDVRPKARSCTPDEGLPCCQSRLVERKAFTQQGSLESRTTHFRIYPRYSRSISPSCRNHREYRG